MLSRNGVVLQYACSTLFNNPENDGKRWSPEDFVTFAGLTTTMNVLNGKGYEINKKSKGRMATRQDLTDGLQRCLIAMSSIAAPVDEESAMPYAILVGVLP